jgi:cytochrome bd ubiquinol oxidase subunit I
MSAETLARLQFAFTIGYHFLFVPISIGLGVQLVIAERRYYKSSLAIDRATSEMWKKIFAATFAIGVATGISMEFAFGANWANYSRFVGDIFGAPLAAEGLIAFFLESTFLGVLLFGRRRVSKRLYYASVWIVAVGAHLSAFWIIVANSWMQTPAGYTMSRPGAVPRLDDFFAAVFNPSTLPRYAHTIAATWVAGAFVVAGICAWYLLHGRHQWMVRRTLGPALVVALVATIAMPLTGDRHAKEVYKYQPTKLAAFEGLYQSRDDAPLYLFGWVDTQNEKVEGIAIPGMLSFLAAGSPGDEITGMDETAPDHADRPPVQIVFQSYHLMVGVGTLMVLVALAALVQNLRGKLESSRWLLWAMVFSVILPFLAIMSGWTAAEVGRQPWIVQGLMRTADAISPTVSRNELLVSLSVFALLYALLFVAWLRIVLGIIAKGPQLERSELSAQAPRRHAAALAPVPGEEM